MTYNVFISYANTDARTANAICRHLEQQGTKCWIAPRDIEAGVNWAEAIVDVIPKVKIFLLVFSEKSNMSKQVIREVELAIKSEAVIIPVRIENVQPTKSMAYYLSSVQWMNANQPLTDNQLDHIYKTVKKNLEKKPSIRDIEPNKDIVPRPKKRWVWVVLAALFILSAAGSVWHFGLFNKNKTYTAKADKVLELNFDSADDLMWMGITEGTPGIGLNTDEGYLHYTHGQEGGIHTGILQGQVLHFRVRTNSSAAVTIGEMCLETNPLCPIMFCMNELNEYEPTENWTGSLVMEGRTILNQEQWIDYMLSVSEDGSTIYAVASDPSDENTVCYTAYIIPENQRSAYYQPSVRPYIELSDQYLDVDYAAIIEGSFIDYLHEVLPGYNQYKEDLTVLFSETPKEMPPFSVTGY